MLKNSIVLLMIGLWTVSCSKSSLRDETRDDLLDYEQYNLKPLINSSSFEYKSKILNEKREIYISLPPNYQRNIHRYPVIFVLDGEFLFDIARSVANIRAQRNYMPESIVIGLSNGSDRLEMALLKKRSKNGKLMSFGGKTKEYLKFFKDELIPYLEKNYRVSDHRTIIGMSPTVGPVFEDFWSESSLFTGYIALAADLHLYLESNELISDKLLRVAKHKNKHNLQLYIGRAGDDVDRNPQVKESYQLTKSKFKQLVSEKLRYKIEVIENESHYGMSLPGIQHGFELIYKKSDWDVEYRRFVAEKDPSASIKIYYERLSTNYGVEAVPTEDGFWDTGNINFVIDATSNRKNKLKLIQLALNYFPNSPLFNKKMAELHVFDKKFEDALGAAKKVAQLTKSYEVEMYPESLHYLADIYELNNQKDESLSTQRKALVVAEEIDEDLVSTYQALLKERNDRLKNSKVIEKLNRYTGIYQTANNRKIEIYRQLGTLYARAEFEENDEVHEEILYKVVAELVFDSDQKLFIKGWTANEHFTFSFDVEGSITGMTMMLEDESYIARKVLAN